MFEGLGFQGFRVSEFRRLRNVSASSGEKGILAEDHESQQ